jgi:hypothetical protein
MAFTAWEVLALFTVLGGTFESGLARPPGALLGGKWHVHSMLAHPLHMFSAAHNLPRNNATALMCSILLHITPFRAHAVMQGVGVL